MNHTSSDFTPKAAPIFPRINTPEETIAALESDHKDALAELSRANGRSETYINRINELVAENANLKKGLKDGAPPPQQQRFHGERFLSKGTRRRIMSLLGRIVGDSTELTDIGFEMSDRTGDEGVLLQLNAFALGLEFSIDQSFSARDVRELIAAVSNARQKQRNAQLDKDIPIDLKPKMAPQGKAPLASFGDLLTAILTGNPADIAKVCGCAECQAKLAAPKGNS